MNEAGTGGCRIAPPELLMDAAESAALFPGDSRPVRTGANKVRKNPLSPPPFGSGIALA
jgi:hypothetical protein